MLLHGWQPEPDGRGTWSILWSCLATIILCTWSALHQPVPTRHGKWRLSTRKLGRTLLAIMAPEITLMNAANNWFQARAFSKHMKGRGNEEWTMTHALFACARGFTFRTPEGDERIKNIDVLQTLIDEEKVDGPSILEEELRSRSKSDWAVNILSVIQIVWFLAQILFRAIQHYHITSLEIMTVAYVCCSIFIYSFCWNLPQDVEYPVILEVQGQNFATTTISPAQKSEPRKTMKKLQFNDYPHSTFLAVYNYRFTELLLFALSGCGFGAIHCLAWNSAFPSPQERLGWRVCSAATTAIPTYVIIRRLGFFCGGILDILEGFSEKITTFFYVTYFTGRMTIIILALMGLRALPANAFKSVNWSEYIPHFAV